jgi:hypothetical protein
MVPVASLHHIPLLVSLWDVFFVDDTTRHDTTRHNTTQHDTTRHNTTRYDTTQHNTTQHDTTHIPLFVLYKFFPNFSCPVIVRYCQNI